MITFTLEEKTTKRYETITTLLNDIGIPQSVVGYDYIREILFTYDPTDFGSNISVCDYYRSLAKKFDTTSMAVERAIRHAIDITWITGNYELQQELFSYTITPDKGRPTNKEFLALIVNTMRVDPRLDNYR